MWWITSASNSTAFITSVLNFWKAGAICLSTDGGCYSGEEAGGGEEILGEWVYLVCEHIGLRTAAGNVQEENIIPTENRLSSYALAAGRLDGIRWLVTVPKTVVDQPHRVMTWVSSLKTENREHSSSKSNAAAIFHCLISLFYRE